MISVFSGHQECRTPGIAESEKDMKEFDVTFEITVSVNLPDDATEDQVVEAAKAKAHTVANELIIRDNVVDIQDLEGNMLFIP